MSCQICDEKLNKSTRKPVECILCEGDPKPSCCLKCFTTFLLTSSNINPSCMFCKNELTLDFVHEIASKTFSDQYNNYRFEKRFEIEKSRLPETQEEANRIKWTIQKERQMIKLHNQRAVIHYQKKIITDDLKFVNRQKIAPVELNQMNDELKRLSAIYTDLNIQYHRVNSQRWYNGQAMMYDEYRIAIREAAAAGGEEGKREERKTFIKACPDNTCRGFLSTAYKCGTCDKYFCPDCNEVKNARNDDAHVCNEETKATMELIKSDSKPCPKCHMMIFRISGCPQMWCVQCHTAFNWNTGIIDDGHVHNPEYFRYLRETGQNIPRNPNDVIFVNRCMRLPSASELRRAIGYGELHGKQHLWTGWYDFLNHVRGYMMPHEIRNFRDMDYSEYRIAYLNDEITEEDWKKTLKMKMKKHELQMERYLILDMFCNVITDLFINLMENKDLDVFSDNSVKIFEYTNTQMEKLNKKFSSKDTRYFLDSKDGRVRHYFLNNF